MTAEIARLLDADLVSRWVRDLEIKLSITHAFGRCKMMAIYRSKSIEAGEEVPDLVRYVYQDLRGENLNHAHLLVRDGRVSYLCGGLSRWYGPTYDGDIEGHRELVGELKQFANIVETTHISNARDLRGVTVFDDRGHSWNFYEFSKMVEERACAPTKEEIAIIKKVFGRIPQVAEDALLSMQQLFEMIDNENIKYYARMCGGTLKKSQLTKELAKTKELTQKILNYAPDIAQFADDIKAAKDLLTVGGPLRDDAYLRLRWMKNLINLSTAVCCS